MNRSGAMPPQTLRGMPNAFGGQQQPQPSGRTVSNRLPNGKIANNGAGWAFGGGVPMGGTSLQTSGRQLPGGNLSFAQSLSGSQPATPLDLSDFPSLSNNSQLPSATSSSLWSTGGTRGNMGGSIQRNQQPTPISSQHAQQDDFFSQSRMNSGQGQYRFGNQNNVTQSSQPQPSSIDEFPPLNNNNSRNGNGEIGQERGANLMSQLGFGVQGGAGPNSLQGSRSGNGLLNALSANNRTPDARSPDGSSVAGASRPQDIRSSGTGGDEGRQKPPGFREDHSASQSTQDPTSAVDGRNPLGAIGSNDTPSGKNDQKDDQSPAVHDPLSGMAPIDKWGLKGLRTLMNNYPDYNAAVTGLDPTQLGVDLTSPQPLSTQIFSLFNNLPARAPIPEFRLPDCYTVNNVQPLENKISNFNEETLMWIFYSCPGDIKQHMAAHELYNRQWRWHKKMKLWLTKDELMQPRILSAQHEEGYYIVWDTTEWRKQRRTLTLHYADLDASAVLS
ncbi:hypothetical protein F4818DRAFT_411937 [Hypoxylon cercidicola]|nr:hypothetical protein F4818DRAFT_411937 [Hypoxylon cercidicola]